MPGGGWPQNTSEPACRRLYLASIVNTDPALKSRSASMGLPNRLSNNKNFMNVEVGLPHNSESATRLSRGKKLEAFYPATPSTRPI
jgi:hypothetical protein